MGSAMQDNQHLPSQPRTSRGILITAFAILGSAIAWFLHLCVMYFLVQPVCRVGGEYLFHVATVVALALCSISAIVAWNHRDRDRESDSWPNFVAAFGVVASAIFAYAVVYQWIPVLTTAACEGIRPLQ